MDELQKLQQIIVLHDRWIRALRTWKEQIAAGTTIKGGAIPVIPTASAPSVGAVTKWENASGAQRDQGTVVIQNGDRTFGVTNVVDDADVIGVLDEDAIAVGEDGKVRHVGYQAIVLVQGNVTAGHYLRASATTGRAEDAGADITEGTFGIALTAYGGGGAGDVAAYVDVGLQFNRYTDAEAVAAMAAETDVSGHGWVTDEDDMASDDDTKVPTQQSVKAYVDTEIGNLAHGDVSATGMKQSMMLTAAAGRPTTTSGCAAVAVVEAGTNKVDYCVLAFDKDSDEYAFWGPIPTPDNWDGSTLTAVFYWSCASGVGDTAQTVCWSISMIAMDNDDPLDQAWGTAVTVTDTWIADADLHESAASSAITPATSGTREAGDLLFIRVMRDVSEDDLAGDARLIAVKLEYGVTALSS